MSRNFSRDFRDIKYRFLKVLPFSRHLIPATFKSTISRDIWYPRLFLLATFSFLIEKIIATFDFSRDFGQNRHEIEKNRSMIRDIRDIKYPRLLNFYNFATFSTRDF